MNRFLSLFLGLALVGVLPASSNPARSRFYDEPDGLREQEELVFLEKNDFDVNKDMLRRLFLERSPSHEEEGGLHVLDLSHASQASFFTVNEDTEDVVVDEPEPTEPPTTRAPEIEATARPAQDRCGPCNFNVRVRDGTGKKATYHNNATVGEQICFPKRSGKSPTCLCRVCVAMDRWSGEEVCESNALRGYVKDAKDRCSEDHSRKRRSGRSWN